MPLPTTRPSEAPSPASPGSPGSAESPGVSESAEFPGAGREWAAGLRVPLTRFNAAPAVDAESLLLGCCRSRRWAARIAAHRPYPDMHSLLAAVDEASYDLGSPDLAEALAAESAQAPQPAEREGTSPSDDVPGPPPGSPPGILAAHTALRAAHSAYQLKFGHAFLICLDGYHPYERLDQTLAGVRTRLGNDAEEERVIAADELRRLARGRLTRRLW